jgi:SOS-response transcriptional repressor LexA
MCPNSERTRMNQMWPLTKRQREVYDFVVGFIRERGMAPSLDEIGKALGMSSTATIHKHLENLKAKGWIRRRWGRSRDLEVVGELGCCPMCGVATPEAKVSLEIGRKSDTMGSTSDVSASAVPTTPEVP